MNNKFFKTISVTLVLILFLILPKTYLPQYMIITLIQYLY